MRMWMLPPETLCRQHLLGEHSEIHKHRPSFVKKHSISGRRGQIEPRAMETRHDELVAEMLSRGYKHASPYTLPDLSHLSDEDLEWRVDLEEARKDLHARCVLCRQRWRTHA